MKLGDKIQATLEGDITRTGTVVYIHLRRIFYILEFECAGGNYRESFLTGRERSVDKRKSVGGQRIKFTAKQDEQILKSKDVKKLAKQFRISVDSIYQRRRRLQKRGAVA